MQPIIELNNISYTYPNTTKSTLNDINLSFEKGKFYTICGVNGAGKTTLGLLLRGFVPKIYHGQLSGECKIDGQLLDNLTMDKLCSKIGYVFQNPFTQMTAARDNVFEEIGFGLENLGVEREEIISRVEKTIELLGLQSIADRNPMQLSGGQKQKVAIASIIVMEPEILILDEPTSQLDPQATKEIFEILSLIQKRGTTIILIEHKIELIYDYTDQLILMDGGKVLVCGEKNDVFASAEFTNSAIDKPIHLQVIDQLVELGVKPNFDQIDKQTVESVLEKLSQEVK